MAAGKTGEFLTNTAYPGFTGKIVWSESYDETGNRLQVDALYIRSEKYGGYWYPGGEVKINGVTVATLNYYNPATHSANVALAGSGWWPVGPLNGNKDFPWKSGLIQNPDGSVSVDIEINITLYRDSNSGTPMPTLTGKQTVQLTATPGAGSMDAVSSATGGFDGTLTYQYTPRKADYYNRCIICADVGGELTTLRTINLGKKAVAQQTATMTLTSAELEKVYKLLPKTSKGTLRFILRTYTDAYVTQIGEDSYRTISLSIPKNANTLPTVGMTLNVVNDLPAAFAGLCIQGKSKVDADFSGSAKYGASITGYEMSVGGASYGDPYISGYLPNAGEVTVKGTAKDSRGFSASETGKVQVIAYSAPKILPASGASGELAVRCDADGNPSDSGIYLKILAKRSYSPVLSNGVQKNFCRIRYRYKLSSAASYSGWTEILAGSTLDTDEIVTGALLGGVLSEMHSYHVQVQAIDDVGEAAVETVLIPTDEIFWHRMRKALGLGKYVERENLLDVAWDTQLRGEVLIGDDGVTLKDYILAVISEGG